VTGARPRRKVIQATVTGVRRCGPGRHAVGSRSKSPARKVDPLPQEVWLTCVGRALWQRLLGFDGGSLAIHLMGEH
jgi:hypothetical protein